MSVAGYLGKSRELRLTNGIPAARVEGAVLEGIVSVERGLAAGAVRAFPVDATGQTSVYESVARYDPVLRAHCRLDE
jgi:hypothetical protein